MKRFCSCERRNYRLTISAGPTTPDTQTDPKVSNTYSLIPQWEEAREWKMSSRTDVRVNSRTRIASKIAVEFRSALTASTASAASGTSSSPTGSGIKALIRSGSPGQVSTGSKQNTASFNRIYSRVPAAMARKVGKCRPANAPHALGEARFTRDTRVGLSKKHERGNGWRRCCEKKLLNAQQHLPGHVFPGQLMLSLTPEPAFHQRESHSGPTRLQVLVVLVSRATIWATRLSSSLVAPKSGTPRPIGDRQHIEHTDSFPRFVPRPLRSNTYRAYVIHGIACLGVVV